MGKLLDNLRKKHAASQSRTNRHALCFLAHKDEVAEALREGWTVKQVWEQMVEDGMTTMSYANLCRLAKKHITPFLINVPGEVPSAEPSSLLSTSPKKSRSNASTKSAKQSEQKLTEKERLDLLKEQTFKAVRAPKSTGPLIGKPKTREEEDRELFRE